MSSHRTDAPLTTRSFHVCCWCGEAIPPRSTATLVTWAHEGRHTRRYFHPECHGAEARMSREDFVTLDEWYEEGCMWYMERGTTISKG